MDEDLKPTPEEQEFMQNMASIESSNGLDTAHQQVNYGIQKGTTAMGKYGMMPNTVKELVERAAKAKQLSKNLEPLQALPDDQMDTYLFEHPETEDELALRLQRHIRSRPGVNTPEQANYMWQYGHNLTGDKLKERNYDQSERSQKFKKIRKIFAKE